MSSYSSADDTYDSGEPSELDLDLAKLIECATQALNAKCTAVRKLTRGVSHEVFTLQLQEAPPVPDSLKQAGFSCIARFSRLNDTRAKLASEIATARYLRRFSSIPVPEIYYYDLNPDNGVGAPFILMQRMPGRHLNKIWDTLSLDGKKSALSEIAAVIAQLPCFDQPKGPFSSSSEYMRSFISIPSVKFSAIGDPLQQAGDEIERFLYHDYLQPPFCLIHADFDGQNMLFANSPDGSGPKLTGLIDFEYAYTGPLYFLYEYPIFIQDVSWSKELYTENAILRAHFIRAVWRALPDTAAQSTFISSMNGKNFALNGFRDSFMTVKLSPESLLDSAKYYVQSLKDGTEPAYSGRLDYTPERYTKTADPLPYGEDSDNGEDGGKNLSG
ncbi:kinase-like domain-containing protein [Dichotomopilus funicola]|uniref:Kinase-like domain-containing protein n=1 Tax=Dichotomopilus funicola TaxID=1934379 RepID=A0AAN6V6Z8_9PEZI|nr:kinase-like domain-containing protein [Dichotomopilus funicola]